VLPSILEKSKDVQEMIMLNWEESH
jgi:hypothetical protein